MFVFLQGDEGRGAVGYRTAEAEGAARRSPAEMIKREEAHTPASAAGRWFSLIGGLIIIDSGSGRLSTAD
jgi:hypothetical protein